jgi:chromosome segregation ATPase
MTNDEAISIINKATVEQKTLKDLWGQFSVALMQLGDVLKYYGDVSLLIPKMEVDKDRLNREIETLDKNLAEKKVETQKELAQYRDSLEKSIAPLEKELKDLREKVMAAQGALKDAEKGSKERIDRLAEETDALEKRRDQARQAIRNLHQNLSGVEAP